MLFATAAAAGALAGCGGTKIENNHKYKINETTVGYACPNTDLDPTRLEEYYQTCRNRVEGSVYPGQIVVVEKRWNEDSYSKGGMVSVKGTTYVLDPNTQEVVPLENNIFWITADSLSPVEQK